MLRQEGVKIIPLQLGSIVVMCSDSRLIYNHGIIVESENEKVTPKRFSVTMRYQPYCDKNENEYKDHPDIYKMLRASKFEDCKRDRQRE